MSCEDVVSFVFVSMDFICTFYCLFFFFKQKTAYEMRISDWSSDVCSSDLVSAHANSAGTKVIYIDAEGQEFTHWAPEWTHDSAAALASLKALRSEEHTSELQSLMRISYAVYCLQKKNHTIMNQHINSRH